jgi:hypothetical protein
MDRATPLLLLLTGAALAAVLALGPRPGGAALLVFPPWTDAAEALGRLAAAPEGWRLRRVVAGPPLASLLVEADAEGTAPRSQALRGATGAWLVLGLPATDCLTALGERRS